MDGWMNGVLGHFYALSRLNWAGDNRGGWTLTRIAKRCKNKRVDALRGGWTLIEIAKKSVKMRGLMH